jgi:type I restriction enzyme S subunit
MMCKAQKLRDIITLEKGKPPTQQPYFGPDAELYLTPEYLRGRGTAEPVKASANAVRVSDGDTIVLWDGSNAVEFFRGRKGILASTMSRIRHGETFDVEYFFYAVKSWESYLKGQTSGSGIPHVDKEVLSNLEVFQFAKSEQIKIAEILSTVDRAIEQTKALIAKQQRIKTGLMQDLLTRGIDEHGNLRSEQTHEFKDSPLGRIPVEWKVNPLDVLATRGSGHTPNKRKTEYWNGGIKWISLADSSKLDQVLIEETDKEISDLGIKNSYAVMHLKGTVILSRDAGVGKSAILGENMAVSQHFMAWRCKPAKLDNYYLYYWLQRDKSKFEGIASGSTIVTIGLQFFKEYMIAAPKTIAEQKQISEILSNVDHVLQRSWTYFGKLKRLKTALMQDLLTGKKRVTALLNDMEGT